MNTQDTETTPATTGSSTGRRSLITNAAVALAGVAAAGFFTPKRSFGVTPALTFANIPGTGDTKVLNFALALEDLEADLYAQALMRLTSGGFNKLGQKIAGFSLPTSEADVYYLIEFGKVEMEHRDFLRGALGASAISPFKYDFNMGHLNRAQVLDLVYTAEKTGTSAYLGAIPYLATKTYLQIAGAIQGTEARHTAAIAEIINSVDVEGLSTAPLTTQFGGTQYPLEPTLAPDDVLKAVSPFIVV